MLLDEYVGSKSALDDGKDPGPGYVLYKFPEEECLKFHVIGPCGECDFYGTRRGKKVFPKRCIILKQEFPRTFGCINFKKDGR